MTNLNPLSLRRAGLITLLLFFFASGAFAQPQYANFTTGGTGNSFPFNIVAGKQIQCLFLPGDFNQPSPAPAGNITHVYFRMGANVGPWTYTDFVIKMGHTNLTVFAASQWYTGTMTTVYNRASVSLSATAGGWLAIELDTPFPYDPAQSLVIDVQQCGVPGATGFSSLTTTLTGFRRNTSLVNTSCPFVWGQQSGSMNHIGIDVGPAGTCSYNWASQTSGTTSTLYSVKAVNSMIGWAAGVGATVRKTTDGGVTWTNGNPNPGVITGDIYAIEALGADTAWCTTSPSATFIYRTTNGGTNWTQVHTQAGGFFNVIKFQNSNNGFIQGDPVGSRWSLWRTSNGGATWDSSGLYFAQTGSEAGWNNSASMIGNNIWFGTNNSRVYYSSNFGTGWLLGSAPGSLNTYSVHFNSLTAGLAGGTAVVKSSDNGASWSGAITVPGSGNINGMDGKGSDFWLGRGTGIYRSTDNGDTWNSVHTAGGTVNHLDFYTEGTCLNGWAVGSGGSIARMNGVLTGVQDPVINVPASFKLNQNYPNPFNPSTTISFDIPKAEVIELKVFDMLGREVATLVNGFRQAGIYRVDFDASALSSGVYIYRIKAGDFVESKKMTLLK